MSDADLPVDKKEFEEHFRKGIAFVKEANVEHEYEDILRFTDEMLQSCVLIFSTNHILCTFISNELGLYHARNGSMGHAFHFLYSAIKFWQNNPSEICEETVNTYLYLGIAYTVEPAFALGKLIFENAHLALERIDAEKSEKAAEVLCFEAELYLTQEDYETALELTQKSLDMLADLGIENAHFKGRCLLNIARIFRFQKKIFDSLTYYEMAVTAYFAYFGAGHSIIEPVLRENRACLDSFKEEKGSEILILGSENN